MPSHLYGAVVSWHRRGQPFSDCRYSRAHEWKFDGGAHVHASASPINVPIPLSDPSGIDPEEALVAAAASCHMLCFLHIAAQRGFVVESYRDEARGTMHADDAGRLAFSRIDLSPRVEFTGECPPTQAELEGMHHAAHEQCFIASSLRAEVVIMPVAP